MHDHLVPRTCKNVHPYLDFSVIKCRFTPLSGLSLKKISCLIITLSKWKKILFSKYYFQEEFKTKNISTVLDLINSNILDHPMKPFGLRYWQNWDNYYFHDLDAYLEHFSPQACSWLRDQEYLLDFKYYDRFDFMQMVTKVR